MNYLECVCSSMEDIILDNKAVASQLFYYKLLNGMMKDTLLSKGNTKLSQSVEEMLNRPYSKNKEYYIGQKLEEVDELLIGKDIEARAIKVGGIGSLMVENKRNLWQILFFRKKEFSKYEVNLINYLKEKVQFTSKNKYIVAITKDCEKIQDISRIEDIQIKKIGESKFVDTQRYVAEVECVYTKILPNIDEYRLRYVEENNLPIKYWYNNLCGDGYLIDDFVSFLKEIVKRDVERTFYKW